MNPSAAEDILAHFGVKGMKWGVRRSPKQLANASEDHDTTQGIHSKVKSGGGTRVLSNKEIKTAIERMNLEQNYARMTMTPRQQTVKFVSNLLGNFGKNAVNGIVNSKLKAVTGLGGKAGNPRNPMKNSRGKIIIDVDSREA